MPTFRNLDELYIVLDSPSKKVLKYITEKSINTIKDEIDRYGIGKGGDIYNSTGEFREAFIDELANRIDDCFVANFGYDSSNMSLDEDNFIHGSFFGDAREGLAEIIFEGKSGKLFGEGFWTMPRDAWESALKIIDKSINKWFKEGFNSVGFKIK